MTYFSIVVWAALVTTVSMLLLMGLSAIARCMGWHQTEGVANVLGAVILATLIGGTIMLIWIAGVSFLIEQL